MTWDQIKAKHPHVAKAIEARLVELKNRIVDDRSRWLMYCRAKLVVAKRIGWHAPRNAPPELREAESFESAMRHAIDFLGV